MEIKNKVKAYKVINVETFLSLVPNSLKEENRDIKKLKNGIRKNGFSYPVILWEDFIIDGAGRQIAVKEMVADGCVFSGIPAVYVEAKDIKEAKQKALEISSQFGKITKESFISFADDLEVDFETINIKGINDNIFIAEDKEDEDLDLVSDFQVIISCNSLEEQEEAFNKLNNLGYICKTLNL